MQIVQKLAGYTLGRADLVRRAMSKKKAAVMEQERKNFVYGNEAEGVPGCISRGIPEKTANKIFDDMTDFAKYAFNKSHAAAYAVVSYQTAWLKYYYPVEFMAALMTSVIDNPSKVAEYILNCRQMGIEILPPDINAGYAGFSVSDRGIHYGLSAIKSIGRSVIDAIVAERKLNGNYKNLKDFISRLSNKEINKRTIENFIKAGALDSLEGTRKQKMLVYVQIMDEISRERKTSMTGQMSLFDLVDDEMKASLEIRMPDVGEFDQSEKLAFEKEVLGVYLSGHPLQECEERWRKAISHTAADFMLDEETGTTKVMDGEKAVIGGIISAKSVKLTKNSKQMAYLTIEDLLGTVEVIVFPRDYENNRALLEQDAKVFVQGRVSCEDDKPSRLICEKIIPFDQEKQELWIQFADKETFAGQEIRMLNSLKAYEGDVPVVAYLAREKQWKKYPPNRNVELTDSLVNALKQQFGEHNIKIRTLKAL